MSDPMRFGLSQETLRRLNQVFSRHPLIEQVLIYGSRAKGNFRHGSDIDLTLKGKLPFDEFMQLHGELDDLLLPYTIDLSQYAQLDNAELIAHIDRVGVVTYSKDEG